MKKILLSSLIAVMAVSAANAKIASTDYADSVATTAKNAAISAAAEDATTKANTAESNAKADTVAKLGELDATVSATDGVVTAVTQTDGKITGVTSAKVTSAMIADNAAITKAQLADTVQQSLTKADNAATTIGTEAIAKGDNSAIVNATTLTGAINELSSAVKKVSGGELTLGTDAVSTGNILNGAVTEVKLDTNLAQKINNKADSTSVYTKTDADSTFATKSEAEAASTAAAAAQATADEAVVANTAITAGTGTKITYDAKGLVTGSANLEAGDIPTLSIEKISGLQDALNSKQATLTIDTALNADSTNAVENKAIATAINTINTSAAMTSGIDSTKVGQIATNTTAINNIKTAEAGAFANDTKAYVLTATRDTNGVLQYKWEEIDRTVLNND